MKEIRGFIANLRSYDEGGQPADGWYVAYDDLLKAADTMEKLLAVAEIADGIQALHKGKAGGLGQWTELREALNAVQTRQE